MDELHQLVLEHDLAGRHGEIAPELEGGWIGLADSQLAGAGLDVLRQHVHAAHQILRIGSEGLAQQFRIGENEIRRRNRIGDLPGIELRLPLGVRVEIVGFLHQPVGPGAGEQIGLLEEVEELVRRPFRIGKALVACARLGDRGRGLARQPFDRVAPKIEIGAAQPRLQLERALRIGQPVFGDLAEGADDLGQILRKVGFDLPFLARLDVGGQRLAAFLDHARQIAGKGLHVETGHLRRRRLNFSGAIVHGPKAVILSLRLAAGIMLYI